MHSEGWQDAKKVLCVRLDQLGDVLMTTPAIRALKESRGERHITLLTSTPGENVAQLVPEVDETIVYDAPWVKATATRRSSRPDHEMADRLRQTGFDAVVIFTVYSQNPLPAAFLCYMADIPLRLAHCRENPYQLLTDWIVDPEPEQFIRHEVRRQLDLVAAIGARTSNERLSLRVPPAARARVIARLQQLGIDDRESWIVVHAGASAPSRRYPQAGFAEVVRRLIRERGYRVLFTGTGREQELVQQIQQRISLPSHSLVGQLTLGELAALLEQAPLLLSNNSGPVHIAAAVGTPVVDLYALTNPQHTPWAVPNRVLFHDVSCKYCYKSICPEGHQNCLRLVPPSVVYEAVTELLEETVPSTSMREVTL